MIIKDLAIVGGGPAGLSAGIYAARADLKAVLFEQSMPGGLAASTEIIENYPGFSEGIGGPELAINMEAQAKKFGLEIVYDRVEEITKEDGYFYVKTDEEEYKVGAVILATGVKPKFLNIKGEREFHGRGVSFCATCDGALYRDKRVAVIGGGDSALEEAISLTRFAKKVFIIHRRDKFRATKYLQQKAMQNKKIEFLLKKVPVEISGAGMVEAITLKDVDSNVTDSLQVDGVFIYVGFTPSTDLVKGLVELDENGYIITDEQMSTNIAGIFAAGDVRKKMLRQVVTAVSDGATAAETAEKYLEGMKG